MSDLPRIQDDLYLAVNGEWLETAVIPDDKPLTGGFADLDEGVEKLLMADFAAFAKGEKKADVDGMNDAVDFYRLALDADRRNKEGMEPVLPLLKKIQSLSSVAELNASLLDLAKSGAELPVQCGVDVDMADATKHCFALMGPRTILPDTTYYDPSHPAGGPLLECYKGMAQAVLAQSPLSPEEQARYLEDTLAYDRGIAKTVKSQLEWADYVKNYNPMPLEEVAKLLCPLDLKGFLKSLYGENIPDTIVVYDPRAIKELHDYFNEATFEQYKHWSYVRTLLNSCAYLSLPLRDLAGTYRRALMGVAAEPSIEKSAYRLVSRLYDEPIGIYYGRTYFGEEAKKDVVALVHKIIDTYKKRVREGFLSPATKEKAILKLSTIEVKMGYPDFVHDLYKKLTVNEDDSFYSAFTRIQSIYLEDNFAELDKPVDRNKWGMPGHMVNASYNPSMNDITFPAAILQKPFYSLSQKVEENLGGIGAVIGHEISHAFDNNGASFDENGNLAQWWTPEDFETFKGLTKGMIDQFDGIEIHGGKLSGELVVSENIADNGGMAVTLEIMKGIQGADYQSYFKNWARVWCRKAKPEYTNYLLQNDVHSPAELRANMQPRNFPEWYAAFDVKPTDAMYLPEDKRIIIW